MMGSCQSWAAEQEQRLEEEREAKQTKRLHRELAEAMKSWSFDRLMLVEHISTIPDRDLHSARAYISMFEDAKAVARLQRAMAKL